MLTLTLLIALFTPQEKATVYFYRIEEVSRFQGNKAVVYLDDKKSLEFPERRFAAVLLKPGSYELRLGGRHTARLLKVEAGRTYFFRVSRTGDGFQGMRDAIHPEDEEQARFQMRGMKPLESKNIKDRALELAKPLLE